MKQLILQQVHYQYLEKSFAEWLDILGYAPSTVYMLPIHLREFFFYLEQQGINHLQQIEQEHIKSYYYQLKHRSNQRNGGALSNNTLNKHHQTLTKFSEYLSKHQQTPLPLTGTRRETTDTKAITILTTSEIKALYTATNHHPETGVRKYEAIAARDRAMLTIFYSCGIRRNEGYHLNLTDINFDRKLVHIRKGKNYKERFIPFNKSNSQILQEYIYDHRPQFYASKSTDALFISVKGQRMNAQSMAIRLKLLAYRSDEISLQQKNVTLHNLRHSIATHLLQAGMPLEKISKFLGHSSLESTQVYTHLMEKES